VHPRGRWTSPGVLHQHWAAVARVAVRQVVGAGSGRREWVSNRTCVTLAEPGWAWNPHGDQSARRGHPGLTGWRCRTRRCGGCSTSGWAGACSGLSARPKNATRKRSSTGWRTSGRGLTKVMCVGLGTARRHQGAAVLPLPDDSYDTDWPVGVLDQRRGFTPVSK
jgi:hypothetical protein